jgi:hypothetical protein
MVRSAGAGPQLSSGGSLFKHYAQITPRTSILSEEDAISKLAVGAHSAVLATTPAQPRFQSPGEPKCGCTGLRVIEAGCATESAIADRNVEVARPRSGPRGPRRRYRAPHLCRLEPRYGERSLDCGTCIAADEPDRQRRSRRPPGQRGGATGPSPTPLGGAGRQPTPSYGFTDRAGQSARRCPC